jgi:hypothetical protein
MQRLLTVHSWIAIIAVLWMLPWKGVALWRSARRGHTGWFVVFLVINTLAILEILYIFIFSKMGEKKEQKKEPESKPVQPANNLPSNQNSRPIV